MTRNKFTVTAIVVAIVVSLFAFTLATASPSSAKAKRTSNIATPAKLFKAVNKYRAARNINTLKFNKCLATYAQAHAKHMARTKKFQHQNTDQVADDCGLNYVGENLAVRTKPRTANAAIQGWHRSESHRVAMQGPWSYLGTGVAHTKHGNTKVTYYVALFGQYNFTPHSAPEPDNTDANNEPTDNTTPTQPEPQPQPVMENPAQVEADLIDSINAARSNAGLSTLAPSSCLQPFADGNADRMARDGRATAGNMNEVSAACPNGGLSEMALSCHYTAADAHSSMMNDSHRRGYLMDVDATEIAVAIALTNDGVPYYSILISKPRMW